MEMTHLVKRDSAAPIIKSINNEEDCLDPLTWLTSWKHFLDGKLEWRNKCKREQLGNKSKKQG